MKAVANEAAAEKAVLRYFENHGHAPPAGGHKHTLKTHLASVMGRNSGDEFDATLKRAQELRDENKKNTKNVPSEEKRVPVESWVLIDARNAAKERRDERIADL